MELENRVVYATKKSSVRSMGKAVFLPRKLREFAQRIDLNLKVKIYSDFCPLRMGSMSVGIKPKLGVKPVLHLFSKRYYGSKNQRKFHLPNLRLSNRFRRDYTIKFRRVWEKKKNHVKRKGLKVFYTSDGFQDVRVSDGNVNIDLDRRIGSNVSTKSKIKGKADMLKNRLQVCHGYRNYHKQKNTDETKELLENDLRHKLNKANALTKYTTLLECTGVSTDQTKYSASFKHLAVTISNDYFSGEENPTFSVKNVEENFSMNSDASIPQQELQKAGNSTVTISNSLKANQRAQTTTCGFTTKYINIKNTKMATNTPAEVNKHVTKGLGLERTKNVIGSEKKSKASEHQFDSSDDEDSSQHPNRRLQCERMSVKDIRNEISASPKVTFKCSIPNTERSQDPPKSLKASEMWEDILRTPDLWSDEDLTASNCDEPIDYDEMLESFVCDDLEEKIRSETPYLSEKRFLERPDNELLLSKFYIPPAQMEVFYQTLTEEMTAQECLVAVCEGRKWPKPEFIQLGQLGGFKFCCHLMGKNFVPTKSASNTELAKELAASQWLDWLGVVQKGSSDREFGEDIL